MNSQNATSALSQKGISTTRKHIYFYLLLLLATPVLHSIWRNMNDHPGLVESREYQQLHEVEATARAMAR
jgi:hypothetical protein